MQTSYNVGTVYLILFSVGQQKKEYYHDTTLEANYLWTITIFIILLLCVLAGVVVMLVSTCEVNVGN